MPDRWDSCLLFQPFQPGPAERRVAPVFLPRKDHPAFFRAVEADGTGLNCEDFRLGSRVQRIVRLPVCKRSKVIFQDHNMPLSR
jgi:hypothetical protein